MLSEEQLTKLWEHIAVNRGNGLQVTAMTLYNALHDAYQQNKRQQDLIEWAARIIGSGLDNWSQLRYDPMKWIREYHGVKGGSHDPHDN